MARPLRSCGCCKLPWLKKKKKKGGGGLTNHRIIPEGSCRFLGCLYFRSNNSIVTLDFSQKYRLSGSTYVETEESINNCRFESAVLGLLWKEGAVNLDIANPRAVHRQKVGL